MSADTSKAPAADKADEGKKHRSSSAATGVLNVADLERDGVELVLSKDTQKLNWKINSSSNSVDDPGVLKKMLTTPPIKKIDLVFPTGIEITARNLKGVTIKDALDSIHKQFKKRADDELDEPYLAGFEWDKEESWQKLKVHLSKVGGAAPSKKKKGKTEEE